MVIPTCVGEKAADLVVVIDSCNLRRNGAFKTVGPTSAKLKLERFGGLRKTTKPCVLPAVAGGWG
jgi:hypothetical protein